MQLEQKRRGDVQMVKVLDKRMDARAAPSFKEQMSEVIGSGSRRIALDIGDVEFIDSSGLGAIVSALKMLGGNGDLVICGARETVMSMFKLTRMDKVFRIFAGDEQAANALGQ